MTKQKGWGISLSQFFKYAGGSLGFVYNHFQIYILKYFSGASTARIVEPPHTVIIFQEVCRGSPRVPQGSSGELVFAFLDHYFIFQRKKVKITLILQMTKVYPLLHKKEIGSEHLSMLDYTAELK